METGAPLLDARRRTLVQKADALLAVIEAGGERAEVERALREFGDYSVRHFSEEEDCYLRGRCPALAWNGSSRAELIGIVSEFRTGFEKSGSSPQLAEDLSRRMSAWVARYIPGPGSTELPCLDRAG